MRTKVVLTLSGPDRVGIVDRLTGIVLRRRGNVEASRMSRLGGEFAVLMLVSLPAEEAAALSTALDALRSEGYAVSTAGARPERAEGLEGWSAYRIEVKGADHEGIIHEVARYLARHGINIESADAETSHAPVTGSPLFSMTALVAVPPAMEPSEWMPGLESMGREQHLEIAIEEESRR